MVQNILCHYPTPCILGCIFLSMSPVKMQPNQAYETVLKPCPATHIPTEPCPAYEDVVVQACH